MKISAVSYLNTKPFLFGLRAKKIDGLEISVDIPSECARKVLEQEVDLGLIPVAVIPLMKDAHILPGFCIGADGKVDSVKLYSHVPLHEIKTILLDYQSRTSVMLARVLAHEFWKITPEWQKASAGFEEKTGGTTAAVVIGDRTFSMNGHFPYEYDLAEEWKKMTGLPFVFAAWVSHKQLTEVQISTLQSALEYGLQNIAEVVKEESIKYPTFDVEKYLSKSLKFRLDEQMERGMSLFLAKAGKFNIS
jgi:chorismate dehydratase